MINEKERKLRKYKNEFNIRFAQMMQNQLIFWKNIQKEERWSLVSLTSFMIYFGTSLIAYVPGKNEHDYDLKFHFIMSIIFFISAVIINISVVNKSYQNKIKGMLFPKLIKIFGDKVYYSGGGTGIIADYLTNSYIGAEDMANLVEGLSVSGGKSNYRIPDNLFHNCGFFGNRTITQRTDDDIFHGNYNETDFIINETDFGWNSKDKHRTYNRMFKGVAMHFTMNKEIKNRVLIFSKRAFYTVPEGYEKVEVEYTKFAKKYNVYVNTYDSVGGGQIEARYLLNTAFLDRFMQLHTSFNVSKLQCSVYGRHMLIMLSTRRDLFEMNHLFGKIDDIKQYDHLFNEFASVLSFIDVLNISSKTKL